MNPGKTNNLDTIKAYEKYKYARPGIFNIQASQMNNKTLHNANHIKMDTVRISVAHAAT